MAKRQIKICLGSSCFSRGNNINLEEIKKFLSTKNLDAEISFSGHLCENLCSKGPIIRIDAHVYESVNLSKLHKILQEEFPC
ncbi:(2Fe-2S) ferredoxin domain-containing protein [Porphyromonadaceae bacterium OttesenSCG-928-L07]|nr:(2Fe-2S) ferredoxin domain-containing protein [Porphyromonadaceae bacterium OttesenSCG-928-L07]MDL2330801.1 (2Fe-2S) ferredoxin domain-containing protein [Odoribacter sp. OttesenSCG-928-A06]